MFPIDDNGRKTFYAIPARINERECNIITVISTTRPYGKILGIRQNDGLIIQKGFIDIEPGDIIQLYYKEYNFADKTENWIIDGTVDAAGGVRLQWDVLAPDMYVGAQFEDAYGNFSYTQPLRAY